MAATKLDAPETVQIVHEFPVSAKPGADVVRVALLSYRGGRYVHLRRWYWSADGPEEELRPGRGLALRLDRLPELKRAVDALCEASGGQA